MQRMSWKKRKRKEEKNNINWDYIKHLQFLIDNEKSDDRFKGEKQKQKFLNHENVNYTKSSSANV